MTATITSLGTPTTGTGSVASQALTTTVAVAAGETVVVGYTGTGSRTVTSISDGTANVYVKADSVLQSGEEAEIWHCLNPLALASGATITANLSAAANQRALSCWKISGTATFDDHGTSASASGSAPSASTAGSVADGEALFGVEINDTSRTITQPGGIWTSDLNGAVGGAGNSVASAHGIKSGAGTGTYNPTLSGNAAYAAVIAAYSLPTGGGPLIFGGELVHGSLIRGGRLAA